MLGTILGDAIGEPFEFTDFKSKDFPLFTDNPRFTDDSLMSLAIANALMYSGLTLSTSDLKYFFVHEMQRLGRKYPDAGFGGMFSEWLFSEDPKPYNSYGNGSAMRVSPVGFLYSNHTLEQCRKIARASAEPTHNHPEGIKGAEATASAIWLALNNESKQYIKHYIEQEFSYDLSRKLDDIRPTYKFYVSCQKSVPEAIICFLEGTSFEDTIRNCVSLGGDSDTQAAIAGGIAQAYFGIPEPLQGKVYEILKHKDLIDIYEKFTKTYSKIYTERRQK